MAARAGRPGTICTAMPSPASIAAPSSCAGAGSWRSITAASSVAVRGSHSDSTAVWVAPMRRRPARNSRGTAAPASAPSSRSSPAPHQQHQPDNGHHRQAQPGHACCGLPAGRLPGLPPAHHVRGCARGCDTYEQRRTRSSAGRGLAGLLCTAMWITCAKRCRACVRHGKCWGLCSRPARITGPSPGSLRPRPVHK